MALCATSKRAVAQTNEWTWMGGSDLSNVNASYGPVGAFSATNTPGSLAIGATWTDKAGNLWIFGGGSSLWELDTSKNQWALMAGNPGFYTAPGVYGTLGVPAANTNPGARSGPVAWSDTQGNLWLFGGEGYDSAGNYGYLNDLWEFNPSTRLWAWIGGSKILPVCPATNSCGPPGVYGTLGTPSPANIPGGRSEAVGWTDPNGNFWLFGGRIYIVYLNGWAGYENDLWKYSPPLNQWAWMGGSSSLPSNCTLLVSCGQSGIYGTLQTPSTTNIPGAREDSTTWTDSQGNLWIFGGFGFDATGIHGSLNDLWQFNPSTNSWTWMSGMTSVGPNIYDGPAGVYGTQQIPAPGNAPGGRRFGLGWIDSGDNLWLFGGDGFDDTDTLGTLGDLWVFNASSREWAWMTGATTVNQTPYYGTLGVPAFGNVPGARAGGASWADTSGNLWLFGGGGGQPNFPVFDDIWEYQLLVNAQPLASPPSFSLPGGTYAAPQKVAISDNTPGAMIFYTTDGSTPTFNSTPYAGPMTLSGSETIRAMAVAAGHSRSYISVSTYILAVNTSTTVAASSSSFVSGQPATFTGTVTSVGGTTTPNGVLQFFVNGSPLGSPVSLNSGVATLSTSALPVGNLTITAAYTPASGAPFFPSTSAMLTQAVYSSPHQSNSVFFNSAVRLLGSGFNHPYGVAVDANGNVFVADSGNSAVKEIVAAGYYVTVNSLGSGFSFPTGLAIDAAGNLFVADPGNNTVFELAPAMSYNTVTNLGRGFSTPYGVAVDSSENLFVADTGHGLLSLMRPCATCGGGYGPAITVSQAFQYPWGVAVDNHDNLFVTDAGNGALKEITATGNTLSVGNGFFTTPYGNAVDANGDLFVSDLAYGVIREISAVDGFTTVSTPGYGMNVPIGVAADGNGNLFVADTDNNAVKEISQAGGNFGSVKVGTAGSSVISMTFFFDASTTLGSKAILTQQGGVASLDFADAGTGTCKASTTYASNDTCTLNVTFSPTQLGTRAGAVELLDGSGKVLALGSVQGTGIN